ncbi:MAG: pyridoxal-dependent decarboxylase [Thermoanaerobaculia bacterium]
MSTRDLLLRTAELAVDYLDRLPDRPVGSAASMDDMRRALGGELPEAGESAESVLERLVQRADAGIVATAGPRYFGFVVGGSLPVAVAADWMTSTWDQNAGLFVLSPANSAAEEAAGGWLREIFGLPASASVGFVTGCQAANFSALAAARHALSQQHGWDVETRGLYGAPEIAVVLGAEAHVTIRTALQMLGLGRERAHSVAIDDQGRMIPAALAETLAGLSGRPTLVCAQAGNVNSGAFDPLDSIADLTVAHGAWLHVDGAFGLWAGASPDMRAHLAGVGRADSWATDAHKWLNVPYDCGLVFCAHPEAHRAALTAHADYLEQTAGRERDPFEWVPEFSRRARGFTVWAALRQLGRRGVRDLVERCSSHARRFAERLAEPGRIEILNDVVLNQVLVRFLPSSADAASADDFTREVIHRVQIEGTCWLSGTTWRGQAAMRISVANWSTAEADVDLAVAAIRRAAGV